MSTLTDHDVFWLARYAHNTLAPLFAEAKTIEPSLQYNIELMFADAQSVHQKDNHIDVSAWWNRDGMFLQDWHNHTKADIDKVAVKLRVKIEKLKSEALQPA